MRDSKERMTRGSELEKECVVGKVGLMGARVLPLIKETAKSDSKLLEGDHRNPHPFGYRRQ